MKFQVFVVSLLMVIATELALISVKLPITSAQASSGPLLVKVQGQDTTGLYDFECPAFSNCLRIDSQGRIHVVVDN